MNLLERMLAAISYEPIPVKKVVLGVHWSLVCSKHCGLGSTMVNQGPHGQSQIQDAGELHHKSAHELAEWILSDNLLEASVGIAAINSLVEVDEARLEDINAVEIIKRESKGKNLAIVGHFPFIERIRDIPKNCWVIEKRPFGTDFPAETAREFLPKADVAAISGTALINHSMEDLLTLCRPATLVLVLGPSTPLLPLFFEYGVDYLSGSLVVDEESVLPPLQQGASFTQLQGVRLVTMRAG